MSEPVLFAQLAVGQTVTGDPLDVTDELVQGFARATATTLGPGKTAPAMLAALLVRSVVVRLAGPPGGIHARQTFTFHRPLRVGDTVKTVATVAGKEQRSGRNYVHLDVASRDATGSLVLSGRTTSIWAR